MLWFCVLCFFFFYFEIFYDDLWIFVIERWVDNSNKRLSRCPSKCRRLKRVRGKRNRPSKARGWRGQNNMLLDKSRGIYQVRQATKLFLSTSLQKNHESIYSCKLIHSTTLYNSFISPWIKKQIRKSHFITPSICVRSQKRLMLILTHPHFHLKFRKH